MQDENTMNFESDFDVEDEYKPEPLCAVGTYKGNVINVIFVAEHQSVNFTVVLSENEGIMSDGTTAVDGSYHYYPVWLPRADDGNVMTPSGKQTKRQYKINQMKKFGEQMKIDFQTKEDIIKGITEGLWMGIPVYVKLKLDTYEGNTRNVIDRMFRNDTGEVITVPDPTDDLPF